MSLNATPQGERLHIGLFGRRNAGKSSLVNALTGQSLAIVSDVMGTTTDPVLKAMELLPIGPVVMIDTPGLDDEGQLGELRVKKSYQMLNKSDLALLVVDASTGMTDEDRLILERIKDKKIPYLIVYNKCDLCETCGPDSEDSIYVSAEQKIKIFELKERIGKLIPNEEEGKRLIGDLLSPSDIAVLVVPIDKAAPKGRLILPQQMTIRDILDADATAFVVKETELASTLQTLNRKPRVVVTDSQVFERVAAETPKDVYMTSFSILMARYKGNLEALASGAKALDTIADGDVILISEGCTHHRQCGDIGTEKLPNWIRKFTGKDVSFEFTSGTEFPSELEKYKMIIHCGGCMLNEKEVKYRMKCAADAGKPMTNYGTAIAYMNGILARSMEIFEV